MEAEKFEQAIKIREAIRKHESDIREIDNIMNLLGDRDHDQVTLTVHSHSTESLTQLRGMGYFNLHCSAYQAKKILREVKTDKQAIIKHLNETIEEL